MKPTEGPQLWSVVRGPLSFAALLAILFLVGFGSWSVTAPLSSAALAPGFIGIESQRKRIQHLEGGIIESIEVSEGDRVEEGALLLRLDATVAKSTYELLEGQFIELLAEQARLLAERDGNEEVAWPALLAVVGNIDRAGQAMAAQRALFQSRKATLHNRTQILRRQISQLDEQIRGFAAQEDSQRQQSQIIRRELKAVEKMVRQGLEREPRLLALQRAASEIEGLLGEIKSRRAQAEIRIGETELEIVDLEGSLINQVTGSLREIAGRIADMRPRLRAARGTLERTEIRAPVTGSVIALQQHTIGGVVQPGGWILDIVPANADFVIEAQISPADIDVVRPGHTAEVRLIAFTQRNTPTMPGKVIHVSADSLTNRTTQQDYYAAHIQLDIDQDVQVSSEILNDLYPGMPVEVMIVIGERTALDYLIQPVADSFSRAFRED